MRSGWLRMLVAALSLFASPTPGGLANAQDNVIRWATNPNYPPYDWAIDEQHYAGAASELLKGFNKPAYLLGGVGPGDLEQAWQAGAQGVAGIRAFWPG